MADVRKLMAKLMPRSPSFGMGSGGVPDLTPQDVAAAIGMCPPGLGRELMCRLWWPDGAKSSEAQLEHIMMRGLLAESLRRRHALGVAKFAVHIAESGDPRISKARALSDLKQAQANSWPHFTRESAPTYRALCFAAIIEMGGPRQCKACGGSGYVKSKDGVIRPCTRCETRGVVPHTDVERAAWCGLSYSQFRQRWAEVYGWLFRHCVDEEALARKRLGIRLSG